MTKTFDDFVRERKQTNNELVQYMYKSLLGVDLDIDSLWEYGESVEDNEIQVGDILYFKMNETEKRVAIANPNSKFVHFTNQGMKESTLNDDYWDVRFIGARRVIN
ncbi:NlpC/P60 family protein [Paenibacillus sp. NRS-1775]|uniref:C40 family peptidase n=1 Tax=unclassified Paenibacillus TaxID=185978 RepID=UPI003D29ADBC